MNFLSKIGDVKNLISNAIMIFTTVSAAFAFGFNYVVIEQQSRAQYPGNLIAYAQVIKQTTKLRSDPSDVKIVDLQTGLEICSSEDFKEFFLSYRPSYDRSDFENSCRLIRKTLSERFRQQVPDLS